jgi:hypothetical protein
LNKKKKRIKKFLTPTLLKVNDHTDLDGNVSLFSANPLGSGRGVGENLIADTSACPSTTRMS